MRVLKVMLAIACITSIISAFRPIMRPGGTVPESWIREQTRSRSVDPIPHVRLGRYVRFEWNSPELLQWWSRRRASELNPASKFN